MMNINISQGKIVLSLERKETLGTDSLNLNNQALPPLPGCVTFVSHSLNMFPHL